MRILFLCKTPYQIMVAVRIKNTIYKNDICDVIVFDTIANGLKLSRNIDESHAFNKCYYLENTRQNINFLKKVILRLTYRPKIALADKYDEVFLANVYDWRENALIKRLRKQTSPEVKVNMYEDGYATYSDFYGDFLASLDSKNFLKRYYNKRFYSEYFQLKDLFVFTPKLVCWGQGYKIHEIEKIADSDIVYKNEINAIFGYDSMTDCYSQKYIFFEESYYADGVDVADVDLVEKIATVVGKDNLFVKIHPRNRVNRFKELGYVTNDCTAIPWEVIAMNIDIKDKTLLTIASGSALTSLINLKSRPQKIIMFMNCDEFDEDKLTKTLPVLRRIAEDNSDIVLLPRHVDGTINEMFGGKNENSSSNAD